MSDLLNNGGRKIEVTGSPATDGEKMIFASNRVISQIDTGFIKKTKYKIDDIIYNMI